VEVSGRAPVRNLRLKAVSPTAAPWLSPRRPRRSSPEGAAPETLAAAHPLRPVKVPAWFRAAFQVTSALAPGAAARWAGKLFFTPPRARVRPEERAALATGRRFAFEVRHQEVAGWTWGEGPTVLLAHGWGGHAGQLTVAAAALAAAGFRAVAIDAPAHGQSAGEVSSLLHFADAIERAAALCGPLRGLLGHSFGAAGAMLTMARATALNSPAAPAIDLRAVLVAAPAAFDSYWWRFRAGLGVSDRVWRRMMRDAEAWLQVSFEGLTPAALAPALKTPVLMIHDRQDRELPFDESVRLARAWPGAELHATLGLGHLRILRDAGVLARAIQFIRGQEPTEARPEGPTEGRDP
jgi:pimeloyl-ACP methyl ester carboxylesterase